MKKNFGTKKKNGFEKFGDSLSDTEIEVRRNIESGDGCFGSLKNASKKFENGDGFLIAPTPPERTATKAFGQQMKLRDEMKIDLGGIPSTSSSKQSYDLNKLYPIEELSERSSTSRPSKPNLAQQKIQRILEENRVRGQNRPMSASRRIKMDKDFEIRKPYFTSEESEMNSAFNETEANEVAKVISASQPTPSDTTLDDSVCSFKRAQINQLSYDSMQRYQSRVMRFNEDCSNRSENENNSCYTDDDSLLSVRTYSTTKCNSCCFGKLFKRIRDRKKD